MRFRISMLVVCFLMFASVAVAQEPVIRKFPVPTTTSAELRPFVASVAASFWKLNPKNASEWKEFAQFIYDSKIKTLPALREKMGVTVKSEKMGGVGVFVVTPKTVSAKNKDRVLLHFHGGGYVLEGGGVGTDEAIIMASNTGIKVISVDYRMLPDYPYPAAVDDAIAVYGQLLKTTKSDKIGVFGASAGGGLTLALIHRAKKDGLALPAAIAPGSPWSDLTKTGDSYFVNEGVDNMLVSYDGWIAHAAKFYVGAADMKDPMISPVYGDMNGFPPTLLTSGTRDLFLSNTVRVHTKLLEAGVPANLLVFEGMSHIQYLMALDSAESKLHFSEASKFFDKYLK